MLLERYAGKLVRRYDVSARDGWPANLGRFGVKTGKVSAQSLASIHCSKLELALKDELLRLKLVVPSHDRRWLGTHPAIVSAYMIALAGEIARRRGLSPISDNATHVSGVTSCTVEDLARALVSDVNLSKKRASGAASGKATRPASIDVTAERVAFVTLRTVLPQRLEGISAKRILERRARHAGARHAFHGYVEDVRAQIASAKISEPEALDEHIRLEYERCLKPEVTELSRGLRSLGIGTFLGTVGVAVTLPVGSLLGAPHGAAAAAAVAGASLGVAALAQRHATARTAWSRARRRRSCSSQNSSARGRSLSV